VDCDWVSIVAAWSNCNSRICFFNIGFRISRSIVTDNLSRAPNNYSKAILLFLSVFSNISFVRLKKCSISSKKLPSPDGLGSPPNFFICEYKSSISPFVVYAINLAVPTRSYIAFGDFGSVALTAVSAIATPADTCGNPKTTTEVV